MKCPFRLFVCAIMAIVMLPASLSAQTLTASDSESDMHFSLLASTWDEAVPLGNATLGALVWQRAGHLRLSLDRIDLWDLRPIPERNDVRFDFGWVKQAVLEGDYDKVRKFDGKYHNSQVAPTKLPGAGVEFALDGLGATRSVHLYLNNALCEVVWECGATLQTFVHATKPVGWFIFTDVPKDFSPVIVPPSYEKSVTKSDNSHAGASLPKLGYKQGAVLCEEGRQCYHQKGWDNFSYDVVVEWQHKNGNLYGAWSISTNTSAEKADAEVASALKRGVTGDYKEHLMWWQRFWGQSNISVPDRVLQKQYDCELYKFGSVTREDSYPISLQAIWTADNGKLPPWRGDFHHDLNTQLSYWPTYTGNHLSEGLSYLNTVWRQRDIFKKYTRDYFKADGMNIPGVTALNGEALGGWIQYSLSPTVGAWIVHHFYLHWKYSLDEVFLREKGYPIIKDMATFFEQTTIINQEGYRTLEISSNPETFNNSLQAWFRNITNFDLALIRSTFRSASEMAKALGKEEEASHWQKLESELPPYTLDAKGGLAIARGCAYEDSHRHFSHALAIHPLGLLSWNNKEERKIIDASLAVLEQHGTSRWTGFSFTWWANMLARAGQGEKAAKTLKTFAECFCHKNTFHANGDQSRTGKSLFRYRPFTLEANFAGAAALQEMMLQSHEGYIDIFPALPRSWREASFENLRARGALLVSAYKSDGVTKKVVIVAEKGGKVRMKDVGLTTRKCTEKEEDGTLSFTMKAGEKVVFK